MTIDDPLRSSARLRMLLAGSLTLIVLAQFLFYAVSPDVAFSSIAVTTSVGGALATCLSLALARSVTRYPGVEASAYWLPSFFIGYGTLFTTFLLSRLAYSRSLLIADFILTLSWSMGVMALSSRRTLRVGVVPEGRFHVLANAPNIHSRLLQTTSIDELDVDAVAADLQFDLSSHWDRFLADCALRGIPVYHTKHLMESLTGKVELQHLSENSFGMLSPVSVFMTFKHVMDWLVALIFVAIFLPLLVGLGVLIRMDSSGPAIFRQKRIGYRGQPFTVYKFRTMTVVQSDGVTAREAAKTRDGDQRITRIGSFLRRTRLDELPQVLNILKGEMSWIGPRPEACVLSEWYEAELPFYRYRHIVRPGITGWAQVNQGHVAEITDVQEKLYYDFYYIKHLSFWIDILIITRTVATVLTGAGAK